MVLEHTSMSRTHHDSATQRKQQVLVHPVSAKREDLYPLVPHHEQESSGANGDRLALEAPCPAIPRAKGAHLNQVCARSVLRLQAGNSKPRQPCLVPTLYLRTDSGRQAAGGPLPA